LGYNVSIMQPGGVITPGASPSDPQQPAEPVQPAPQPVAAQPPAPELQAEPPVQPDTGWQFTAAESDYNVPAPLPQLRAVINWTASEYVAHDKNMGWYALVVLVSGVVAAVVYFITRDFVSTGVMIVLGLAFAAFGARKPQVLEYSIDAVGIQIGPKHYPFTMFRTFSLLEEDAVHSILLMPLQRFNLPITVYYDPANEDGIIEALSIHLPHEDRRLSPIDNLMRKIRF